MSTDPKPPPLAPGQLEVMLKGYELERADASQALSSMYSLLAATAGLLSLIGFVLLHAHNKDVPGWLVALTPLLPLPFISFGALLAVTAAARVRIVLMYETELRSRYGVPLTSPNKQLTFDAPAGQSLVGQAWNSLEGRAVIAVALGTLLIIYGAIVVKAFLDARHTIAWLAWLVLTASVAVTGINLTIYGMATTDGWLKRRVRDL